MALDDELAGTARIHAAYLSHLLDEGFTRNEAFQLVRDHHGAFSWYALVSREAPPGWLTAPTSNEPSGPIAPVLQLSKLPTTEQ